MSTELTIEHERQLVTRLLDLVAERARREQEIESLHSTEKSAEEQQYQQVFQLLTETYESDITTNQTSHASERTRIDEYWQNEATTVQQKFETTTEEIDLRWQADKDAAEKEHNEAGWLLSSLLDGDTSDSPLAKLQAMKSGLVASRTEIELALTTLDGWYRTATHFLQKCRILGTDINPPSPSVLPVDLNGLHQSCIEAMRQAEPIQQRLMRRILPRLFRGIAPLFIFLLFSGAMSSLIWLIPPSLIGLRLDAAARDWVLISAATGSAIALIFMFVLHLYAAHQAMPDYDRLLQYAVDADTAYKRWTVVSKRECDAQEAELTQQHEIREQKRLAATNHSDSKLKTRLNAANSRRDSEQKNTQTSFPERLDEIERIRVQQLQQLDIHFAAIEQGLLLRREQDFRNLQAAFDERITQSRQLYLQSWAQLVRDWHGGLEETSLATDALCDAARRNCPKWSTVLGGWLASRVPAPETITTAADGIVTVGRIVTDLATIPDGLSNDARLKVERTRFEFPLLLSLADKPSLVVRARDDSRADATRLLQSAMLRYLTTLPPGKVRFTIFDAVGLGANFASFMHLTDIDEQMVTSRIWTEPSHIEKRLSDLTEHMETVLQTYLRNEYETLDDYNRQAGEVAEPYRILVVANFPANFTDVALRRLVSIVEGGVKCGVFVLISVDETQELPRGFSLADIERHATVLRLASAERTASPGESLKDLSLAPTGHADVTFSAPSRRGAVSTAQADADVSPFRLADRVLGPWPLIPDAPPSADDFGEIVRQAGQLARSVRRVEVPFERVMPPADGFWTSSTRAGLDVPIGRAGATKLQHLRLGKGTSQHVLIAGKTGSGKSSLLHAMITNAALHYSPDEIEFYLIDFKKGVEFKTYATHKLPHARVIAVESDREFGVSVLQRLDDVLKDRGELYRRVGVQDLQGYRDARPGEPMPRVLLVIDEFQEFFVEDDSLSQTAALLFDRLIRQGRAFGVHVLLGSQTLAGAYSLARSTLGQIAVRVALQCSDTDAHLILSEDNTAARLLSRPGEAIYNDANGLIEGNHPFQVVWLDDSQRETYLGWMHPWADEFQNRTRGDSGRKGPRWPDAVVFEGNIAADPLLNPRFEAATQRILESVASSSDLAEESPPTQVRACWLGEAVALTGATELRFGPRDGGPMLIVGRDEDAALGVLSSSLVALAGQGSPARFVVLDGSLPESVVSKTWQALSKLIPTMKVVGPRDAAAALQEVVDLMQAGHDTPRESIFVIAYDLSRFRDLRKADDDFGGFGGFDKAKTVNPSALFAQIVKDGPAESVFAFAWCDGYQTAQRWLGRELLNRFEIRVLFSMNANDSSNLIDSPAAGRLGPNRALLYRGDLGTLDKFRPYKALTPGMLEDLSHQSTPDADPIPTTDAASTAISEVPDTEPMHLEPLEDLPAPQDESDIEDTWTDIGEMNVKW